MTEKQKQRFLSGTTIHEVHRLLGTAFQYPVEWGILVKSPVPTDSPKKSTQERTIWTVEEMRAALDSMEDPILHLAVHLTLVGALREGEIVGLTPNDIDFDAADGIGTFRINKSMQRVRKEALNQVDDGCIIKIFPDKLERSTTSLILKSTKTASSCRTIFMTSALKEELNKWLNQLAADESKDPERYHDSGMLFRLPNGLAVEPVLIRKKFLKWQDAHPEFPRIVFHGLRHSSATYQLMISGGDVKAVQGTTGHATADMLVNTYAHIQQSSRVELGRKFEEGFYAKSENPSPQAVPAEGEPTISMTALLELLKNADPEVKVHREKINKVTGELRKNGLFKLLKESFFALLSPIIILGCIYSGVASPTEAAVISVFYAVILSVFIYKSIEIKDIFDVCVETIRTFAPILFILATSVAFSRVLTLMQVPQIVSEWILTNFSNKITILFDKINSESLSTTKLLDNPNIILMYSIADDRVFISKITQPISTSIKVYI